MCGASGRPTSLEGCRWWNIVRNERRTPAGAGTDVESALRSIGEILILMALLKRCPPNSMSTGSKLYIELKDLKDVFA